MKHLLISLITTILIACYTLFSFVYLNIFVEAMTDDISEISENSIKNEEYLTAVKETFESKKNMLILMVSTEHISNIENYLISLESAVKFKNSHEIDKYKALLQNIVDGIGWENYKVV